MTLSRSKTVLITVAGVVTFLAITFLVLNLFLPRKDDSAEYLNKIIIDEGVDKERALSEAESKIKDELHASCIQRMNGYKKSLLEANYCKKNDDCMMIAIGCPFNCHYLVNKDFNLKAITGEIGRLKRTCRSNCHECNILRRPLVCIDGMCTMAEDEPIEDET